MSVPYTDSEASEARQWSNRYGPPNAWTASLGTAARMIGRLLDERERLMAKQTGAEYRAWVAQNAAIVKASKEGLREQFAYAALAGRFTDFDAFKIADAMLRERCRSGGDCPGPDNAPNLDAAPAARGDARECAATVATGGTRESLSGSLPADLGDGVSPSENDKNLHHTQEIAAYRRFVGEVMNWISEATSAYAASCSSDGGRKIMAEACMRCWDAFGRIAYPTAHGAAPAARASVGRPRTDNADLPTRAGTGDTPVAESATTAEPVAWAVAGDYGDYAVALFSDKASAQTEADRRALVGLRPGYVVIPLYRQPPVAENATTATLTDAERAAVAWAEDCADSQREWKIGATLRGLLERMEHRQT